MFNLFRFFKPLSPLQRELRNLKANIAKTERYLEELSEEFWRNGGVCCPGCGVPEYHELEWKQERRAKRVEQIEHKLSGGIYGNPK